ncbi:MAG: ABC transporter permease [Bowdeniella nasicola]|nr:ABC transporter permease [Bowdeniella nasicola]
MDARFGSRAHVVTLIGLVVVLAVVLSILVPDTFPTIRNLQSMLNQIAPLGVLAICIGLTFLIGGIDLSIVAVANGAAVTAALVSGALGHSGSATAIGLLAGLGVGLLAGLVNGFLVSSLRVHPIPITLGTMSVYIGITTGITNGATVFGSGKLSWFPTTTIALLPLPFILFLLLVVGFATLTTRTKLGFRMYAVGESTKVARFARMPVERVQIVVYACSGVLAALAGLMMMASTNAANVSFGSSYLMQAILVAVIAGIDPYGGTGRIAMIAVGALAMQELQTGINMLLGGWSGASFAANFIWGLILIFILGLSRFLGLREIAKRQGKAEAALEESEEPDGTPGGDRATVEA